MNKQLRACGLAALVMSAMCLSLSEADAGGRRQACHCQSYYGAPTANYSTTAPAATTADAVTEGRQRYQSAYQAPAPATHYYAPEPAYYYGSSVQQKIPFQDQTFQQQLDAGRKIRGL